MAKHKSTRKAGGKIALNAVMMAVALAYLLPLWYVLNNSFKVKSFISKQPFYLTAKSFTLNNIAEAFDKMEYLVAVKNSLLTTALTIIMLVIFGSLAGFGITYAKSKPLEYAYTAYVAVISIPLQIAMVPLIVMMRRIGLTDSYLGMAFIYNASYLPFIVFLYTGFMRTIPRELIDSAKIDGCGPLKIYLKIFMPLITTITGVVIIIRGVSCWNDLFVPLIVVSKPSMFTLPLKLYVFATAQEGQWHIVFGGVFLCIIPIIILFFAMQKTFIKGIMSGSIKG